MFSSKNPVKTGKIAEKPINLPKLGFITKNRGMFGSPVYERAGC
ncbi:hypothetical protein LYNGBM3L_69850 [Moorena producens 3L]|uniref:Uncharacterized protein n=1 Tax=Moorena producens 3L TaxID=489825 RepID=F4Y2T9_9CYAN|nr:hypothetical protein LYNGBM3L_69850 [Moorena producens 3L]